MKFGVATAVRDGCGTFRACARSVRAAAEAARLAPENAVQFVQESSSSARSVCAFAAEEGCDFEAAPDCGIYDGIGKALDRAAAAGCDVLSWLNADEQYLPAAFGAAQRIFESNAKISIVFGDYLILGGDGRPRAARREIPARSLYLRNGVNYLLSCTVFFRRAVWEAARPFSGRYRLLADKEFYMRALASGFRASLATEYLGAYSLTGGNASLDAATAAAESARLRGELRAFPSPFARAAVRAARVVEKAFHGCYFPEKVDAELFAPDGSKTRFSGRLSPFWTWKSA